MLSPAWASFGGAFLKNGQDATPYSLGDAYVAYEGGIHSIFYNPAGLSSMNSQQFSSSYASVYDAAYQSLSYGSPALLGVLGFSVLYAGMGGIPDTTLDSNNRPIMDGMPFNYTAYSVLLAYSKTFNKLSLGMNLKYIKEDLKDENSSGVGMDVGAQLKVKPYLLFGACVKNLIAPQMSWSTGSNDSIEPAFALGCAMQMFAGRLAVNIDYDIERDLSGRYMLGLEYRPLSLLKLRGGLAEGKNLRFGLGLDISNFKLDLAYGQESEDYLENIYRLTLGFKL